MFLLLKWVCTLLRGYFYICIHRIKIRWTCAFLITIWLNIDFSLDYKLQHFSCLIIQSVVSMTRSAQDLQNFILIPACVIRKQICNEILVYLGNRLWFLHILLHFFTHMTIQKPNLSLWNKSFCILRYSFSSSA